MALELGGPDISANIVPQYGQWQGNVLGDWRDMETAVSQSDGDVFIADIDYSAGPFGQNYDQQLDRFSQGDKLFHWTEARIPTRFRVWTVAYARSSPAFNEAMTAYFAANDAVKDAAIDGMIAALPNNARLVFDQTIAAMPPIDREYWRFQMVNDFIRMEHHKYQRGVASRNATAQVRYQGQAEKWKEKTGVGRVSPRIEPTGSDRTMC
jgi:hypothetical protein